MWKEPVKVALKLRNDWLSGSGTVAPNVRTGGSIGPGILKALLGPVDKLDKIKGITATPVDVSDVTMHKTISTDSFFGDKVVHSVAKIAYEWYCYINGIEEYKEEYANIVGYILGENNDEKVKVVADGYYYCAIDQLLEVGTNSLLQYDDGDGYRYVVFDLWKTIV